MPASDLLPVCLCFSSLEKQYRSPYGGERGTMEERIFLSHLKETETSLNWSHGRESHYKPSQLNYKSQDHEPVFWISSKSVAPTIRATKSGNQGEKRGVGACVHAYFLYNKLPQNCKSKCVLLVGESVLCERRSPSLDFP